MVINKALGLHRAFMPECKPWEEEKVPSFQLSCSKASLKEWEAVLAGGRIHTPCPSSAPHPRSPGIGGDRVGTKAGGGDRGAASRRACRPASGAAADAQRPSRGPGGDASSQRAPSTRPAGGRPGRGRAARTASLSSLRPGSVDVPCPPARRAAVGPREPVRGQGRRASGGRCPVADPRAKLRAPRGDIFPAGPPAPASAPGQRCQPGAGGGPRTPPWRAPRLAGGGVTSHPGRRGHRRCGNPSVAEERGLPGPPTRRLGPAVGAPAPAAPGPSRRPRGRLEPVDALVTRLEAPPLPPGRRHQDRHATPGSCPFGAARSG